MVMIFKTESTYNWRAPTGKVDGELHVAAHGLIDSKMVVNDEENGCDFED